MIRMCCWAVGEIVERATCLLLPLNQSAGLSFELQNEFLLLQMEHEKLNIVVRFDTKQVRITLELEQLSWITEKLRLEAGQGLGGDRVFLGDRSSSQFN